MFTCQAQDGHLARRSVLRGRAGLHAVSAEDPLLFFMAAFARSPVEGCRSPSRDQLRPHGYSASPPNPVDARAGSSPPDPVMLTSRRQPGRPRMHSHPGQCASFRPCACVSGGEFQSRSRELRYAVSLLAPCCELMTICCQRTGYRLPAYSYYAASVFAICCQPIHDMLPACSQYAASVLAIGCQRIHDMLSAYHELPAAG